MKTLTISAIPFAYSNHQFPSPIFPLPFLCPYPKYLRFSPLKSFIFIKPCAGIIDGSTSAGNDDHDNSNSLSFGGWDDLGLGGELVNSGESNELPGFLVSIGIDSKKYIFVFLFGIFCAFAVSRIRVSSVILFPASVLIFGVGFSLGFFRGGSFSEFSTSSSKKRVKDEIFRANGDRLKSLVGFFDGLDFKINDLKIDIRRAIDTKEIGLDDLENYVGVIDSIQALLLNSRNVVENTMDVGNSTSSVLAENQKSSGKNKKEIGEVGLALLQFVGGLFGEKLVDQKPTKVKAKDNVKQGVVQGSSNNYSHGNSKGLANDQTQVNSLTERIKLNGVNNSKGTRTFMFSQGLTNKSALDWDSERRIRIISGNAKLNMGEVGRNGKQFLDDRDYSYQCSRLQFMENQHVSWNSNQSNETKMWKPKENLQDSVDFNFSFKHMETKASIVQEQMLKQSSGAYESSNNEVNEDETYTQFREEGTNDNSCSSDCEPTIEGEVGSSSSKSFADDVVFDRYLSEANNLIKQAKECIRGRHNEEHAEILLHKSAKLLSKALSMKPVSLLAVGLLGNTYLLLGELKLKTSRELRTLLSRRDPLSVKSRVIVLGDLDEQELDKAKIASVLINVCEECEELLVEAGRKYKLALAIDGNDVRALYNWGLALSFRAQLIADIGPEAAFDADKVFLAAIDKFNAIMSKGNVYAPDALYRWGVVLQQRSRLRPRSSKEKVKLLMQAKRLYEDALNMDCENHQVREAILSCVAELNHWQL